MGHNDSFNDDDDDDCENDDFSMCTFSLINWLFQSLSDDSFHHQSNQ